jgi:hypothetical protein
LNPYVYYRPRPRSRHRESADRYRVEEQNDREYDLKDIDRRALIKDLFRVHLQSSSLQLGNLKEKRLVGQSSGEALFYFLTFFTQNGTFLLPKLHIYPVFKVVSLFIGFLSY